MRKRIILLVSLIVVICLAGMIYALSTQHNPSLEKNYGLSYLHTNNGEVIEVIEDVVPSQEELVENLEKEGYKIIRSDTVLNSELQADRIYAERKEKFIDICYNLSEEEAEEAFKLYEQEYKQYYLMARNENFVYCISDKKTFKKAGFESLANVGVQYIFD